MLSFKTPNFEFTIKLGGGTTVSILLVRKANAKGSVSGFEIAPPSKGGSSNKHLVVNW